ncbi:ribonuclease HI family protein [Patescibacteria group bacterium]|nr:ribonuclease HI family protein [Patescibacteria group bacterium]
MNAQRMILDVYTDGGARGNPGPAAIGVLLLLRDGKEGRIRSTLAEFGRVIGNATNNVAEYSAVLAAYERIEAEKPLSDRAIERIAWHMDSLLVVQQLNGLFKVKHPTLRILLFRIKIFEQGAGVPVHYIHIPRMQNARADRLVNKALDSALPETA